MNWKLALRALRNLCAFIGAIALFSYFANFAVDLRHWYLTIASAFVCAILWLGFYVIEVRGGITQVALRFSRLRPTSRTKSAELPSPPNPCQAIRPPLGNLRWNPKRQRHLRQIRCLGYARLRKQGHNWGVSGRAESPWLEPIIAFIGWQSVWDEALNRRKLWHVGCPQDSKPWIGVSSALAARTGSKYSRRNAILPPAARRNTT